MKTNNEREYDDDIDIVSEALALLVQAGRVEVSVNEDGERVFRLVEES